MAFFLGEFFWQDLCLFLKEESEFDLQMEDRNMPTEREQKKQDRPNQPSGSKQPYEPEPVRHGQSSGPGEERDTGFGRREEEEEEDQDTRSEKREKKMQGKPEDQKI